MYDICHAFVVAIALESMYVQAADLALTTASAVTAPTFDSAVGSGKASARTVLPGNIRRELRTSSRLQLLLHVLLLSVG